MIIAENLVGTRVVVGFGLTPEYPGSIRVIGLEKARFVFLILLDDPIDIDPPNGHMSRLVTISLYDGWNGGGSMIPETDLVTERAT